MFNNLNFTRNIRPYVEAELAQAREKQFSANQSDEFSHLENAHVLGQASTRLHVKVHFMMLFWALRHGKVGEFFGQILRIIGAATKTGFGLVPSGNTGGSNVSPFKVMPINPKLQGMIDKARRDKD